MFVHGRIMNCIEQNEIIDSILNTYKKYLGKEFEQSKNSQLSEVFRWADLVDLSLGLFRNRIGRKNILR